MKKIITLGMATYDDHDGVFFSIQALRMYHEIFNTDQTEIILVDNNPDSPHGKANEKFMKWIKNGIYIPYTLKKSTTVRNEIFRQSKSKYTISMDCHVLIFNGAISSLLEYYSKNPDCKDIITGPLVYDGLDTKNPSTHFKPGWSSGMWGTWDTNHEALRKGDPFEIPMQGCGLFSCETKNWVGFNKKFKGFGGEEGYIHEKFRQFGGKAICLPQLKWMHRFSRPQGVPYPLILEDRIWNYFIGWLELTQDPEHEMITGAYEHFKEKIPPGSIDYLLNAAIKQTL